MFPNVRIGSRLAIAFAIVLVLSIVSTAYAIIAARDNARATELMMAQPLSKERLVSDWYVMVFAAVGRTALIARSSDEALSTTFAGTISEGVKRSTGLIKQIEPLLTSDEEKAMMKSIQSLRATFQVAKEQVMASKKAGDPAVTEQLFNSTFTPAAAAYERGIQDMLAMQRKAIDDTALAIDKANTRTIKLLLVLGTLAVLTGAVCAVLITRSITVPLK
ncbi:hypothetical protein EJB06_31535, partial [Massilia atriviolacea]